MTHSSRGRRLTVLALLLPLALAACPNKNEERQKQIAEKTAQLQPEVSVLTVKAEDVLLETVLGGRLEAVRTAYIVPQVGGIVKRRLFEEGSFVKAGQPLYQLDDAAYRANLESARASLLSAQAALAKANADVSRYQPLVQADAISRQEWDAALTAKRSAEAQVKSAQAAINAAQVNVNHAYITAPIAGIIGESKVSEGALVTANSTQMALIQQNDPMYLNIQQSANDMLKLRQQLSSGERVLNEAIEVGVEFEDGSEYPHKGRLLFTNTTVDESTGQVNLRAAIPNPNLILMSGLYVRVKLPVSGVLNAYVVPQRAVTRGKTDTVTIVTPQGTFEPRTVKIVAQKGDSWIISEGLKDGDKVAVDGTMIAGMLHSKSVKTKEWQPEKKEAASAPATAVQAASAPAAAASAPAASAAASAPAASSAQ